MTCQKFYLLHCYGLPQSYLQYWSITANRQAKWQHVTSSQTLEKIIFDFVPFEGFWVDGKPWGPFSQPNAETISWLGWRTTQRKDETRRIFRKLSIVLHNQWDVLSHYHKHDKQKGPMNSPSHEHHRDTPLPQTLLL